MKKTQDMVQNKEAAQDAQKANELAAIPTGSPSMIAQTAVTPDGKQPNARRSSVPSTGQSRSSIDTTAP